MAHYKGKRLLVCPDALRLEGVPADPWDARFAPGEFLTGGLLTFRFSQKKGN